MTDLNLTGDEMALERASFERHWYEFYHSGSIHARPDGTYFGAVQFAWEAWHAAILAQQAATAAEAASEAARDPLDAFKHPMPPFGMLVRALRIISNTLLMDMADVLQLTPAQLSAYECGRKPIPTELPRYVADFFAVYGMPDLLPTLVKASFAPGIAAERARQAGSNTGDA